MAQTRSRRLRKKLHLGEFQEIGFTMRWRFPEKTESNRIDRLINHFINDAIEPNGLGFSGSGYHTWEGIVCSKKRGSCTEEHRKMAMEWLIKNGMENVQSSELIDIWFEQPAR